ncbi:MAG: hypothetical protein K2X74_00050 [Acetobacteraceae bacterium]|nr:hypothetical protein [Acetobacteraceae bacterium]
MPLTIDAADKFKAAMLGLTASGISLVSATASKVLPGEPARRYFTPAEAYRSLLRQKSQRQVSVRGYAAFRQEADNFDPSDAKALQQQLAHQMITRDVNQVSQDDWDRLLKPGGLIDSNIADLCEGLGEQLTVVFIRHQHDHDRLKRIEILYPGCATPQVVSMHW